MKRCVEDALTYYFGKSGQIVQFNAVKSDLRAMPDLGNSQNLGNFSGLIYVLWWSKVG